MSLERNSTSCQFTRTQTRAITPITTSTSWSRLVTSAKLLSSPSTVLSALPFAFGADHIREHQLGPRGNMVLHRIYTEEQDIWDDVLLYVWSTSPMDIFKIRQTCRHFEQMTRQRGLWCKILQNHCGVHGIPPSTFDLSAMNSSEIECAVLRPHRFEQHLSMATRRNDSTPRARIDDLTLDTSFAPPDVAPMPIDDVVETTALCRGGRFLLGVHAQRWLACWDLQREVDPGSSMRCAVATQELDYPILRVLVQQSPEDPDTLVLALLLEPHESDLTDNIQVISLNLNPRQPRHFEKLATGRVSVQNRASWAMDGSYILVAGVLGFVAMWDWRNGLWGVAKLSHRENDGFTAPTGAPVQRAIRFPRVTIAGPALLAVNFPIENGGLACHLLTFPPFYPSLDEALALNRDNTASTQIARIGLSSNFLIGVFVPSWKPNSAITDGKNGLIQMLIWDDTQEECVGRYISLNVSHTSARPQLSPNPHLPTPSIDNIEPSAPVDVVIHFGAYVVLPRPGLFDEVISGRLACIGCQGECARSQMIDGPNARGVLPPVVLGECPGVTEFSYMDCWSGVLGVASNSDGKLTLRTFSFLQ